MVCKDGHAALLLTIDGTVITHLTQYREIYLAAAGDMNVAVQARLRKVTYNSTIRKEFS